MNRKNGLIIFAKAPVSGQVKTRLMPHLSPDDCADLHASFIIETINIAKRVEGADIFLYCHPSVENPFFQKVSEDFGIRLMPQSGNDLGKRLENAINNGLTAGYEKVIVIGSDSPDLPPEYIQDGFKRLDFSDMVIGPSVDGGYYLIGGKRDLPVFYGIPWSSDKVFETTLEKAVIHGITFSALREWYDIDRWEDLQRLHQNRLPEK